MSPLFVFLEGAVLATSYGGWANRSRVWFDYSVGSVSQSSTHVTVSVKAYVQLESGWSSNGTWAQSWSGYWGSGSQSPNWAFTGPDSRLIAQGSYSVALTDSSQSLSFSATGRTFHGASSHSVTVTVPARFARTPTGLTITRISDGSHKLDWTRNSTYTAVPVQRRTNGGSWVQVGRPSGNVATFTDTTTKVNEKYEYRVAGVGGSGQSAWSSVAGPVYTTPAAVGTVVAEKVGTDIRITATGLPTYATSYEVHDNGVLVDGAVTSWPFTHVAPDAGVTHTYTVYAKIGSLKSAGRTSNTVQLLAPPNAPANLAPNGAAAAVGTVRLSWKHNPVDSSAQTVFEVRYRPTGGAWVTDSGTVDQFFDVVLEAGGFEWQVRTKGAHPDWSPWSAVATVQVIDLPGVAIVAPVGDVDVSFATVEWTYSQAQSRPQSAWRAELLRAGSVVESASGSGGQTSFAFLTPLVDGGTYTVRVRAATGGVWSEWGVDTFTTVFPIPAAPIVDAVWDEMSGQHTVTVARGDTATYEWLGAENASQSKKTTTDSTVVNLVPNPLMSGSVTGWTSEGAAPVWDDGLSTTVTPGEGVYIDLGPAPGPVLSLSVTVEAVAYRVALFDPTGTSVAYWSAEHSGENVVTMDGLAFTPGKPVRLYVVGLGSGVLRVSRAAVTTEASVSEVFDGNSLAEVYTEYFTVERSPDGVVWEMVEPRLDDDSVIRDGEGVTRGSTWYRVTAYSALPSVSSTIVEVIAGSDALWLSGDVGFSRAERLPYNPAVSISQGRSRTVKRYMGRTLGVPYSGGQLSRVVDISGMLADDDPEVAQVDALGELTQTIEPVFLYRDPDGRRIYGTVSDVRMDRTGVGYWKYAIQLEETSR